jgi:hypothetical protein
MSLLEHLGYVPGERTTSEHYGPEALDEHLERRYGHEFALARHGGAGPMEFLNGVELEAVSLLNVDPSTKPPVLLSDALSRHLSDHPKGHEPKFSGDTQRVVDVVYGCVGDLPLAAYDRGHARAIRDTLAVGCKSATVERRLAILTAIFNHGIREFSLKGVEPPFKALPIKGKGTDATQRIPFTTTELVAIAAACRALDDDIRWIIAMMMDTGTRLGEIVGLRVGDVASLLATIKETDRCPQAH